MSWCSFVLAHLSSKRTNLNPALSIGFVNFCKLSEYSKCPTPHFGNISRKIYKENDQSTLDEPYILLVDFTSILFSIFQTWQCVIVIRFCKAQATVQTFCRWLREFFWILTFSHQDETFYQLNWFSSGRVLILMLDVRKTFLIVTNFCQQLNSVAKLVFISDNVSNSDSMCTDQRDETKKLRAKIEIFL